MTNLISRHKWLLRIFLFQLLTAIFLGRGVAIGSGPPSIAGCQIFPADNVWNTPVDHLPVSSASSAYILTIGADTGLHPDFGSGLWNGATIGLPLNIVSGTQPKVPMSFGYSTESDPGPYPIPPDALIQGGQNSTGDRHLLVLEKDSCRLYEMWDAHLQNNGSWYAGSGAVYDLTSNDLRPVWWTSADAAGTPMLPGLVRYDEIEAGEINHALEFTAAQTRSEFIWPARHLASSLTSPDIPPMGQRFRLKANFDISGFSPQVQVLLQSLKKYGMILVDNGAPWFISGIPDERWDNDIFVNQLNLVKGSDFEAVDVSGMITDPNSGKAKSPLMVSIFTLPATTQSRTVGIAAFSTLDSASTAGYLITRSLVPPDTNNPAWSRSPPQSVSLDQAGSTTLYAWVKDSNGNISAPVKRDIIFQPALLKTAAIYYDSMETACIMAANGETVMALSVLFTENITINYDKKINILGGFADGFADSSGYSSLKGSFTIADGAAEMSGIMIQ